MRQYGEIIMLKKRYLFLIMIFGLFIISTANAEKIDTTLLNDAQQPSENIDEIGSLSSTDDNNISINAGQENWKSTDDATLKSNDNIIYFDSAVSVNGDGSKSNPFKDINQNTLNRYTNSGNTLTAYFAKGTYNLNYNFIIKSPNVVLIGENSENTIFNSVLSNKYDFEILKDSTMQIHNISFNHANIINHGTFQSYNSDFQNSASFSGKNAPLTSNAHYNSSYGGIIICDAIGDSNPYVYLENCTFDNNAAYCGGVISLINSRLVANNSQFLNSYAERKGGAIYAINSTINLQNTDFKYSNSSYGGAIYCEASVLDLKNIYFLYSESYSFGGAIASKYCDINIESCTFFYYCTFTDSGGAIYNFKGNLNIDDTVFYRGMAEFGGAIANLQSNLTIKSSFFKNNTAGHGGDIYNIYGKLMIENNTFYNSSAYMGSAILSKLADTSYLINNTFVNSPTRVNSSCIYLDSCSEDIIQYGNHFEDRFYISLELFTYIGDKDFIIKSNVLTYALSNTGTYYDNYETKDSKSNSNNQISLNVYDSDYPNSPTIFRNYNDDFKIIFNTTVNTEDYSNPMFRLNVHNYFGDLIDELIIYLDSNKLTNGTGSFPRSMKSHMLIDSKNGRFAVEEALISSINSTLSDLTNIPKSYDSRNYGYITPVKDQGEGGNCWAFAGIATLEACIKKATGIEYDFSEENVKNMMSSFSTMGLDLQANYGGYDSMVMGYLTSWFGPILEETDKYDEFSSISNTFIPSFHIQNIKFLPSRQNNLDNNYIKQAIMDYGAVSVTFQWLNQGLHSVSLVGWNDNYNAPDSLGTENTKGVWIFKNSWGTEWGDNGFGYLSYKVPLSSDLYNYWHAYSFIFNENENYMINVHPDFSGVSDYICNDGPITCMIKVDGPQYNYAKVSAFATYFKIPTEYSLEIYNLKTDALIFYQDGYSEAGYFTIPFYKTINMNPGDQFLFSITFNNEEINYLPVCQAEELTKAHFQDAGQFFYYDGYGSAKDLINLRGYYEFFYGGVKPNTCQVPSIHLFSNNYNPYEVMINITPFETVKIGEKKKITISFSNIWSLSNEYTDTIKMIEGSLANLKIDEKNYYAKIHDGNAQFEITFDEAGVYTLSAKYQNNKVTSNSLEFDFEVTGKKVVITARDMTKVYGENDKSVVTLKDADGNPLSNTVITFDIAGKTSTVKTSSTGKASIPLNLAPKSYTAIINYNGNDKYAKSSVKVKVIVKKATPRLTAKSKTFKLKAKTKKYAVVLKNNIGKVMKNVKVTITVNKKTYSAKTNSKGQAVFKLKLTKRGNYRAAVKFAGNGYYNAVSKKVIIKVIK